MGYPPQVGEFLQGTDPQEIACAIKAVAERTSEKEVFTAHIRSDCSWEETARCLDAAFNSIGVPDKPPQGER